MGFWFKWEQENLLSKLTDLYGPPNFSTFRHSCWHRKGATMIAVAPVCCGCNSIKSNVIPVISNQINDAMRINEPSFWITILHNLILIKKFLLFKDLLLTNDYPRATSLTLTFLNKLQSKLCWKFIFIRTKISFFHLLMVFEGPWCCQFF